MKTKVIFISALILLCPVGALFGAQNQETEVPSEQEQEQPPPEPVPEPQPVPKEPVRPPAKGGLSGVLVDELGNPIEGVTVSAVDRSGRAVAETITDEEGRYSFDGLEAGSYTVKVRYSGISSPIGIQFEEPEKRAPIPTGLRVSEIYLEVRNKSFIRARWDSMPEAHSYRCEIYKSGEKDPVIRYEGILNNTCEFGNLEENTEYQVRIYSKNEHGFSTSYVLGSIRTVNKPPFPPFGLGVVHAKNHRLDLVWRRVEDEETRGYAIQLKRGKDPWRYYSPQGLTFSQRDAFVVEETGETSAGFSISGVLENGSFVLENGVSYSVRVFSVDESGTMSGPSSIVSGIVLADTVPPLPPENIKYEFVSGDRLRISWEAKDTDVAKFRVYYGLDSERWDGIVYTEKRYHDLIVEKEKLLSRQLYIAVTAIDRAGNESGYRTVEKETDIVGGEQSTQDFVLSFENVIRDLSPAIREIPQNS